MEMGKPIELDQESLIQYFPDCMPDSKQNETIRCQAKDLDDRKEKLKVYEKIRSTMDKASILKPLLMKEGANNKHAMCFPKKCFKRGERDHLAKYCKFTNIVCFKCKR